MEPVFILALLISLITTQIPFSENAKVFMVLLDEPAVSDKAKQTSSSSDEDTIICKERISNGHDIMLESLLQRGSYTKLYSYTHLLNGFAIHATSEEVFHTLRNAERVISVHEDVKMDKFTTYTPEFLGIPTNVWPALGGVNSSGEGVVIGLIDTGINPFHPSFTIQPSNAKPMLTKNSSKFRGKCVAGNNFPPTACRGKIVGAQYFARTAIATGEFNATKDYDSPFDADGHGSHTASTAAGNHRVPVITNNFNYGYASGMAPAARIAVYKAMYAFGGYMSDVVAAVEQAVEDGVDILSLSIGPSSVPAGPATFLNVLETVLLFATRAGVLVVQAAGNGGPSSRSILSFGPWITSVAASITDRKYKSLITLGNGESYIGTGLAPPTAGGEVLFPIAAAADVCQTNGRLGLLTTSVAAVADTIHQVGAAGFILTVGPDIDSHEIKGGAITFHIPGIILNTMEASSALWEYYNMNTIRNRFGRAVSFTATARISDGRHAIYTRPAPVVASYSSRGPDVGNPLLQTADVLKPNIMAPGSLIWAAWSPNSGGNPYIRGENFALLSGTSMATPHIAGVAALIKQKYPHWSPSVITSAMMTTADVRDRYGATILAQQGDRKLAPATPFDFGAGSINPSRALDPGLVFDVRFEHYIEFLCAIPDVDHTSVKRAIGMGCPAKGKSWCSDLNTPSVTVSRLVGSRRVIRRVTNVGNESEEYRVLVREPMGIRVVVSPLVFNISVNSSRPLSLILEATNAANGYSFGEMILKGNKKHVVRIPITVYVSSSLGY